jgi:putative ABC transport system substrate-binding protein
MRTALAPSLLAAVLAAVTAAPRAGADGERPRVGVLFWHDSPNDRAAFEGVRDGFALARMEPVFEVVEARADDAAARAALRDFESRGLDLVYALGTGAALRARDEVKRAPVVFTAVTDPVGSGVVASAKGSGRNLCGTASGIAPADVLGVFRAALPALRTLGVVYDPDNPVSRGEVEGMRAAAASLAPPVALLEEPVRAEALRGPGAVQEACVGILRRADALWVPIEIEVYSRADQAAAAAAGAGKPILSTAPAAARGAAAVCVTVDFRALGRSSVVLAAAALRGEDPGRMPVARPRSFRVVLNLEAAARSRFDVPLALLASADEFAGVAGGR